MRIVCLDLEGVLVPEIWIAFSERTGIPELRRTTRDEPNYDTLMKYRLGILAEHGLGLPDIQKVIGELSPFAGAKDFLDKLREDYEVIILSDTFYEFAHPLMRQLAWPTLFCHSLEVDAAILYAYMVGGEPVSGWTAAGVERFVLWAAVSGAVVALLLFAVSAFAVPLLCERRCGLVAAVATSVRLVLGNLPWSLLWGALLAALLITSALLLPLLPLTLPWLAYASRDLYRRVVPFS